MHPLHPLQDLICSQQHSLQREHSLAVAQELLERRPVHVGHQCAIVVFHSEPVKVGNASAALHDAVKLGLPLQRGVLFVHPLQFDCYLALSGQLVSQISLTMLAQPDAGGRSILLIERKL